MLLSADNTSPAVPRPITPPSTTATAVATTTTTTTTTIVTATATAQADSGLITVPRSRSTSGESHQKPSTYLSAADLPDDPTFNDDGDDYSPTSGFTPHVPTPHGNNNDVDIPKINLESKQDWRYLKDQFRKAVTRRMRSRLETHYSQRNATAVGASVGGSQRREMSSKVAEIVDTWVDDVFGNVQHGVLINGMDYDKAFADGENEVEPYDETLNQKVQEAEKLRTKLEIQVAEIRKTYPDLINQVVEDQIVRQAGGVLDLSSSTFTTNMEVDDDGGQSDAPNLIGDFNVTKETFAESMTMLKNLQERILPITEKLRRAETVLEDETALARNAREASPATRNHEHVIRSLFAPETPTGSARPPPASLPFSAAFSPAPSSRASILKPSKTMEQRKMGTGEDDELLLQRQKNADGVEGGVSDPIDTPMEIEMAGK